MREPLVKIESNLWEACLMTVPGIKAESEMCEKIMRERKFLHILGGERASTF